MTPEQQERLVRTSYVRAIALWCIAGFSICIAVLWAFDAFAGAPGEFENISPEIRSWFMQQKNELGLVCCDNTEAKTVEDWRRVGSGYQVTIDGKVIDVPPEAVSPGQNIMSVPLAWIYPRGAEVSKETLRCFKPGLES